MKYAFDSLPNNKIVNWSKLKTFADDKIDVTEKLKVVLGRLGNIDGNRRKCGLPAFIFFSQPFTPQILILTHQQQTAFENIVGKGEIARNEQFLLFPQCFLLNQITASPFLHIFHIISSFAAEFEGPKIGISGKGLMFSKGSSY